MTSFPFNVLYLTLLFKSMEQDFIGLCLKKKPNKQTEPKNPNLPKTLDLHLKKKAGYKDPAVNCAEMSI